MTRGEIGDYLDDLIKALNAGDMHYLQTCKSSVLRARANQKDQNIIDWQTNYINRCDSYIETLKQKGKS